jgi:serine/threonine-protein kinase RsbW
VSKAPPNVSMALDARAENVTLVRELLAGLADEVDFGHTLDDIRTAVSEAANNVVMHAYHGGEGPLEIELSLAPRELAVVVRDRGSGGAPDDGDESARGIGLTVIDALSQRSELRSSAGEGTEVAIWFEIPDRAAPTPRAPLPAPEAEGEVAVVIAPTELSGAILGRLVAALAARAGFSIDRLSDVQLLTDALAARVAATDPGGHLSVAIDVPERRALALRLADLPPGRSAELLAGAQVESIGPLIERLADEVEVSGSSGGESLQILLRDHWAGP